jgi:hypothetical protein
MFMDGICRLTGICRQNLCCTTGRSKKNAFGLELLQGSDYCRYGSRLSCTGIAVYDKYIIIPTYKIRDLMKKIVLTRCGLMMKMRKEGII